MTKAGFTLLEILLVVLITGIIALLLVPTFSPHEQHTSQQISQELIDALRYARRIAMRDRAPYRVLLDTVGEAYQVVEVSSNTVITHPVKKQPYSSQFNWPSSQKVDIVSVNGLTGLQNVTFQKDGQPDGLTDSTIILAIGQQVLTIIVQEGTGKVDSQ